MFPEEAAWIGHVLKTLNLTKGDTVLDIGSCSEEYRCLRQPYIDYYIFRPLREAGVCISYMDSEQAEGVDILFDIALHNVNDEILEPAKVVICANLLEHVLDRAKVLENLHKLTLPGGVVILTAPFRYPYHPHPIDTLYRPTNLELEALFPAKEYEPIDSDILQGEAGAKIVKPRPLRLFFRAVNKAWTMLSRREIELLPVVTKNSVSVVAMRKNSVQGSPFLNQV